MRRIHRVIVLMSLLAIGPVLAGCSNFDPDNLDVFGLNEKKKLPGERKEVFPGGVPGVTQGIPPEYLRSNQEAAAAANTKKAAPAVRVSIAPVQKSDFPVYLTGLGTVQGFNTVTVRTRVDGQIDNCLQRRIVAGGFGLLGSRKIRLAVSKNHDIRRRLRHAEISQIDRVACAEKLEAQHDLVSVEERSVARGLRPVDGEIRNGRLEARPTKCKRL